MIASRSAGLVTLRYDCPLTPLEKALQRRATGATYSGGFIDHYIEGVLYPEWLAPLVGALVAVAIVASYIGLLARSRSRSSQRPSWRT